MTLHDLQCYRTLVFDCDGVLLNSNMVKTQAFYRAALPYGEKAASELMDYHVRHGGISRYSKFDYFQREILAQPLDTSVRNKLLEAFATEVRKGLLTCEVAEGLEELRMATPDSRWMVVSGGDQSELREVFAIRQIDRFFNGGIFGSPDDKDTILSRETNVCNLMPPAIFFGDTKYDMEVAMRAGLDFVFVSKWSEYPFFASELTNLTSIRQLSYLLL